MNLLELFVKIGLKDEASDKAESLGGKLKSGLSKAGEVAAKGIGLVTTTAAAAGGALLALEASTEEYRIAQGKLNTAFESAGYSAETAKGVYTDFYKILGDTDTATEASQLLAKLSLNAEDMSTWTDIAAGVWGTFGDSLPIEGLIESANETAKVGQVTGVLADSLNWAGISEDEFNAKLAECGTEAERNQLIMDTLSGTYDEASDVFYRNNEAIVQSRENQAKLQEITGKLGGAISEVKNRVVGEFLPSISQMADALIGMVTGVEGSQEAFTLAIQGFLDQVATSLPQFIQAGMNILMSLIQGIVLNIPMISTSAVQIITTVLTTIISNLPMMLNAGVQLLTSLANGISTSIPLLLPVAVSAITTLATTLIQNIPTIITTGIQLLISLIQGITQTIPQLVAAVPQIIQALVSTLISNAPQILSSGIQLLIALINGIVQTIPQLIAMTPQIISAIVNGIASGLGNIISSGREILNAVGQGIRSTISSALQWGSDIVSNIANGIRSAIGKVTSAISNVASKIRSFLHFSEPDEGPLSDFHTYMPDMIDLMVSGIKDNKNKIEKEVSNLAGVISDGMEKSFDSKYPEIKRKIGVSMDINSVKVNKGTTATDKMMSEMSKFIAKLSSEQKIIVQSVLDGKVIGETVTKFQNNKARAYS